MQDGYEETRDDDVAEAQKRVLAIHGVLDRGDDGGNHLGALPRVVLRQQNPALQHRHPIRDRASNSGVNCLVYRHPNAIKASFQIEKFN